MIAFLSRPAPPLEYDVIRNPESSAGARERVPNRFCVLCLWCREHGVLSFGVCGFVVCVCGWLWCSQQLGHNLYFSRK